MEILIAEDDAISRRILEKTLTNWGYSVVVTEDGKSAWEALKTGNYKLAVLDWMMPGMDGVEICNRVRELKSDNYTYLILLTAKSQKTDIVKGLQSGADDYVTKPFDHEELKSRLQVGKRILFLEEQLAKQVEEISHSNDVMRRDIEIAAQQFAGQIRIGIARIEQGDAIPELIALMRQPNDFRLPLFEHLLVFAPGDQPARPRDDPAAHQQKADQRDTLSHAFSYKFRLSAQFSHASS